MAYPWLKLWTEFASDPKIVLLPEHLQLVYIKLLCICGDYDDERKGWLPSARRIAATLRQTTEQTLADLEELGETDPDDPEDAPLVERRDGRWFLVGFEARQSRNSSTERSRAHRARLHTGKHHDAPCNADATPCNADATQCNADATQCNADATNRCTDLYLEEEVEEEEEVEVDVDVDVDSDAVVAPVTASVTPKRANDHDDDNLMAYFMRNLERASGLIQSEAQADLYREMVADIAALPVDRQRPFVDSLFAEAALKTTGRVKPSWYRAVIDAALRDGRLPGERAPAAGSPKPALRLVTEMWRNPYTGETETHRVAMPVDEVSHGND